MPSREKTDYELNEVSWLAKWVDETVWVSKNSYATFSEAFKRESYFNRGGFLGVEKVPEDSVEAIEKEFARRKRAPSIFVQDGRPWDKMRKILTSRGYVVVDKMLVMEGATRSKREPASNPTVGVGLVGSGSQGSIDLQEWIRTYLQAFYGNERLKDAMIPIMRKLVKDKRASVFLARMEQAPAGCGVAYRTSGGVVGAYCIGTAPPFRGKGVAATLLNHLRGLAEKEDRRLVLQTMASDGLEGFYTKQGFRLAYTKSLFQRHLPRVRAENDLPSGQVFGVAIDRSATPGTTKPFAEVFSGFEVIDAVRELFGPDTDEVISKLKISLDSPRGYLRVDGETGNVIINPEYLKTGHERHLYLDVIHELAHVKQFREGRELYDRRYAYFERPTEIEAYKVAVDEARRIGMDKEEIVEYLRVEWVTEEEFARFVSMMRIAEG